MAKDCQGQIRTSDTVSASGAQPSLVDNSVHMGGGRELDAPIATSQTMIWVTVIPGLPEDPVG